VGFSQGSVSGGSDAAVGFRSAGSDGGRYGPLREDHNPVAEAGFPASLLN
jgi:hypothetical protein